jgi:hypothetical protein
MLQPPRTGAGRACRERWKRTRETEGSVNHWPRAAQVAVAPFTGNYGIDSQVPDALEETVLHDVEAIVKHGDEFFLPGMVALVLLPRVYRESEVVAAVLGIGENFRAPWPPFASGEDTGLHRCITTTQPGSHPRSPRRRTRVFPWRRALFSTYDNGGSQLAKVTIRTVNLLDACSG